MIKHIFICDRCGEDCDEFFSIDITGENVELTYELCPKCRLELKKFLKD